MTYTNKEMLEKVYSKLERIEGTLVETHELAKLTNGKVKFHTKLISALAGALLLVIGWFVSHLTGGV